MSQKVQDVYSTRSPSPSDGIPCQVNLVNGHLQNCFENVKYRRSSINGGNLHIHHMEETMLRHIESRRLGLLSEKQVAGHSAASYTSLFFAVVASRHCKFRRGFRSRMGEVLGTFVYKYALHLSVLSAIAPAPGLQEHTRRSHHPLFVDTFPPVPTSTQ
jgi:hypothetical protein